jgi:hypothetical protein
MVSESEVRSVISRFLKCSRRRFDKCGEAAIPHAIREIDLLEIEKETFIKSADGIERLQSDQHYCTVDPVNGVRWVPFGAFQVDRFTAKGEPAAVRKHLISRWAPV